MDVHVESNVGPDRRESDYQGPASSFATLGRGGPVTEDFPIPVRSGNGICKKAEAWERRTLQSKISGNNDNNARQNNHRQKCGEASLVTSALPKADLNAAEQSSSSRRADSLYMVIHRWRHRSVFCGVDTTYTRLVSGGLSAFSYPTVSFYHRLKQVA